MSYLKGALIEHGTDFMGPIPNIVIFQFNPETVSRTIQIPDRMGSMEGIASMESNQGGERPIEKISFTAHFTAADQLNENKKVARMYGIGPQLAALEKMVFPVRKVTQLARAAIDAVGDLLSEGQSKKAPEMPIPKQKYPRILFIWGITRILPVVIESMSITEKFYDALLNPIQAEVSIKLAVTPIASSSDDDLGKGAFEYSIMTKEMLAMTNLDNTSGQIMDLIPF